MFQTVALPAAQIPFLFWLVLLAPLVVRLVSIAIDAVRNVAGRRPEPVWPYYSSHNATHASMGSCDPHGRSVGVHTDCPACANHPY